MVDVARHFFDGCGGSFLFFIRLGPFSDVSGYFRP